MQCLWNLPELTGFGSPIPIHSGCWIRNGQHMSQSSGNHAPKDVRGADTSPLILFVEISSCNCSEFGVPGRTFPLMDMKISNLGTDSTNPS